MCLSLLLDSPVRNLYIADLLHIIICFYRSQINFPFCSFVLFSLIGISLDYGEVRPNFVRGFNHPCGWFCVPLKDSPGHSLLTGYIQTELRGMLPQSAVDTAMSSTLTNFYSDLKKALKM